MPNSKKPVHNVIVRIKVYADTKQEAEVAVDRLMRTGCLECAHHEPPTYAAIKHWQIKQ